MSHLSNCTSSRQSFHDSTYQDTCKGCGGKIRSSILCPSLSLHLTPWMLSPFVIVSWLSLPESFCTESFCECVLTVESFCVLLWGCLDCRCPFVSVSWLSIPWVTWILSPFVIVSCLPSNWSCLTYTWGEENLPKHTLVGIQDHWFLCSHPWTRWSRGRWGRGKRWGGLKTS